MNEAHKLCGSDEWRTYVRDSLLPWALAEVELGDDVLEVGPGYGATTDVLGEKVPRLTAVEIDGELATMLIDRFSNRPSVTIVHGDATALEFPDGRFTGATSFSMLHHVPTAEQQDRLLAEVLRVLRPGGMLVAGDSRPDPAVEAAHEGDTYNPIDPMAVADRLQSAGYVDVDVKTNEYGWAAAARRP